MADEDVFRRDLLTRIEARRASVQAYLRENRPRVRRRANWTVVLSSLAAAFTAGPAIGGETFAAGIQGSLGLASESYVWRTLCLLALVVSVSAAVLTNLGKSQDDVARLSTAEAANAELEGLSTLVQYGTLPVEEAVKLYQQYSSKIPYIDELPVGPGALWPGAPGPGPGPGPGAPGPAPAWPSGPRAGPGAWAGPGPGAPGPGAPGPGAPGPGPSWPGRPPPR